MQRKIILLLIVVCFLVTSILGCDSKEIQNEAEAETEIEVPAFSQSYSSRDELYPVSFKVYSAEDEVLKLSISGKIYDSDEATEFYKCVKEDINMVADVFGERVVPVSFYLVEETYDGGCYAREDRVYCSIEDTREKNYRMALMQACLSLTEPWMVEGAAHYVFSEKPDDAVLTDYYTLSEDIDILGLFGAYFYPEFASEEEMKVTKGTAASLATYIIDEHGIDSFLESEEVSFRQEWLQSIGVSRVYSDENSNTFKGLLYVHTKDYPLIIRANKAEFYFQIIPEYMEIVEQIENVIIDALEGSDFIIEYLKVNAPRNYERLSENLEGVVRYYFVTETSRGYLGSADTDYKEIEAMHGSVVIHELTHIFIPGGLSNKSKWQFEGIAEYFSFNVYPTQTLKEVYYEYLTWDYSGTDNRSKVLTLCQDYYLSHAIYPESPQDMDIGLLIEAFGVITLTHPELRCDSKLYKSVLEVRGRSDNGIIGNELTYHQSYLFISYLIDKYSLDTVLDFCQNNADFEAIFGDTYENLKAKWINGITIDN